MKIGPTTIEDTFAEAFSMKYTRIVVTAVDDYWLDAAAREFCGYSTSVIGCDAETGIEMHIDSSLTFDGRPGVAIMGFGFSTEALGKAILNRTGQCLMTCPTTAVFDGMNEPGFNADKSVDAANNAADKSDSASDEADTIPLGKHLRFFGDGFQKSKLLGDRRFWRIPVMDGEFIVEETLSVKKGVAGGNFLIQSVDQAAGLDAARRAVAAIDEVPGVITPFPAGVVRSGSKVGSKYKDLRASTAEAFCPALKGRVESKIHDGATCVYEIVIDGVDFEAVANATRAGIHAAAGEGVVAISAGNYGGKLGKHHFKLHEVV